MIARVYVILEHAVSTGVVNGLRRYYKHRDDRPAEGDLFIVADTVAEAVMDEIETWFDTSGQSDA